jgi:hypothetical protein
VVPAAEEFRVWTDVRGKTVEARLVRVENQIVVLEKRDGQEINIPIERLSEPDRIVARLLLPR